MAWRTATIAAIGVVALLGATWFALTTFEKHYVVLRAYSNDAAGLADGTSVRLNGIVVGYLDQLVLTNSLDPKRKIEFVMKVRRRYLPGIPEDSLVGVQATNLLGNYYLDIRRGRSRRPAAPGAELGSVVAIDPNRLLAEMANEFQQIQAIFDRADRLISAVDAGQGNIGLWQKEGTKTLNGLQAAFQNLENDISHGHGTLTKLKDVSSDWDAPRKRIDDLTGAYQAGQGTAGKVQALSAEFRQASDEAGRLTADWNSEHGPAKRIAKLAEQFGQLNDRAQATIDRMSSGQGTAGQFLINPQLSEALTGATTQLQQLSKDFRANPRQFLHFHLQLF